MTLKEKLCEPFGGLRIDTVNELEKIVDKFTIEVLEWIANNNFRNYSNGWSKFDTRVLNEQQLLQMFKKEKGL